MEEKIKDIFPEKLTPYLKALLQKEKTPKLARQFIYSEEEEIFEEEESFDPLLEKKYSPYPFLIHKFKGKILVLLSNSCFANCRFCFRKGRRLKFYQPQFIFKSVHEYLVQKKDEIKEVIFSGGEPLMVTNKFLKEGLEILNSNFPKLIFRFHTRAPLVFPERIDNQFLDIMEIYFPKIWLVLHINSFFELTPEVKEKIFLLRRKGVNLLSQTVLLKGVNDTVEDLSLLFSQLYYLGVKPYYLHQLDASPGTSHFKVEIERGKKLISQLREILPGPAVPLYVQDGPNILYKKPIF